MSSLSYFTLHEVFSFLIPSPPAGALCHSAQVWTAYSPGLLPMCHPQTHLLPDWLWFPSASHGFYSACVPPQETPQAWSMGHTCFIPRCISQILRRPSVCTFHIVQAFLFWCLLGKQTYLRAATQTKNHNVLPLICLVTFSSGKLAAKERVQVPGKWAFIKRAILLSLAP